MNEKVYTKKAPNAIGPYSQAIICNGLVYTSGQIAINPDSGEVEAKDIKGQTEQVMKNLKAVLEEAGSNLNNTIKTTCFLSDMSLFSEFNEVYAEHITEKPARSCVAVRTLPKNVLVEVEVVAEVEG